jgi:hypothetical protein
MKAIKVTLLLLALSLPLAANKPDKPKKHDNDPPVAVPEGGAPLAYVLVSGAAIVGVLVVRKRLSRSPR